MSPWPVDVEDSPPTRRETLEAMPAGGGRRDHVVDGDACHGAPRNLCAPLNPVPVPTSGKTSELRQPV